MPSSQRATPDPQVEPFNFRDHLDSVCDGTFSFIRDHVSTSTSTPSLSIDKTTVSATPRFTDSTTSSSRQAGTTTFHQTLSDDAEFEENLIGHITKFLTQSTAPLTIPPKVIPSVTLSINCKPQVWAGNNATATKSSQEMSTLSQNITIRTGVDADRERIEYIFQCCYQQQQEQRKLKHDEHFQQPNDEDKGPWFDPHGTSFIAEVATTSSDDLNHDNVASEVIGFIFCSSNIDPADDEVWAGGEPFIDDIYVLPEWQGHGIGSALMRQAEQHLANSGCNSCVLVTQSTHGFYVVSKRTWEQIRPHIGVRAHPYTTYI